MRREVRKASAWGLLSTLILAALIVLGSRNLAHFDAALVGYTFAVLFATFGITYRYAMWLQRPPTALYWRRGWQAFLNAKYALPNTLNWVRRIVARYRAQSLHLAARRLRWLAHWLIMWGCILAVAITFPLVFGWLSFDALPGDLGVVPGGAVRVSRPSPFRSTRCLASCCSTAWSGRRSW